MKTLLFAIPFLLIGGLVVHAQGSFSGFAIWNCLPVAASFGALAVALHNRGPMARGLIVFSVLTTSFIAFFHLAWLFDWGGTATGSSTAGLAFIFVPIWACILGSILAVIAGVIYYGLREHRRNPNGCVHCDYDLTGNISGVCPECGIAIKG